MFFLSIDLLCLTVLITLFPSLQNTYSLDVAKLVRGIEYFIAQISAYIYSTNDYKHGGVNGRTPLRPGSSKFKCANIKFSIETGRWEDIDRNDRIYTFCRENNGDEFHYTRQFANMN
jgi:hypothetical protein